MAGTCLSEGIMKRIVTLIVLILLCGYPVVANPIVVDRSTGGPEICIDVLAAYEFTISQRLSAALWGGIGAAISFYDLAVGIEGAVEGRYYFAGEPERLNLCVYLGPLAFSNTGGAFIWGVNAGLRVQWKARIGSIFVFEPYFSVSYPYLTRFEEMNFSFADMPFLTLGFRCGPVFLRDTDRAETKVL